ncbi:hypothetical protein B0H14DRAFT_3443985 [Mycena olivaceomarginata]|nr:hypothetical protein B0H14DRAFT_3443985 [Mycena olivaceomarginata]
MSSRSTFFSESPRQLARRTIGAANPSLPLLRAASWRAVLRYTPFFSWPACGAQLNYRTNTEGHYALRARRHPSVLHFKASAPSDVSWKRDVTNCRRNEDEPQCASWWGFGDAKEREAVECPIARTAWAPWHQPRAKSVASFLATAAGYSDSATRMREVLTGAVSHAIGPRDFPESSSPSYAAHGFIAPLTALAPLENSETVRGAVWHGVF